MTRDELVEAMARAIYESDDANYGARDPGCATLGPWEKFPEHWKEDYRKQARASLSAAEAHGWMLERGWQPIETAPRDGAMILLGRPESEDRDEVAISAAGYWLEPEPDFPDSMGHDGGFTDVEYGSFQPGRSIGNPSHMLEARQPTHWRPLPTPPHEDTDGR